MPVLGERNVGKAPRQRVDDRHDGVPIGNRQGAAGQKIILHVDDEQQVTVGERQAHGSIVQGVDCRPQAALAAKEILALFGPVVHR